MTNATSLTPPVPALLADMEDDDFTPLDVKVVIADHPFYRTTSTSPRPGIGSAASAVTTRTLS